MNIYVVITECRDAYGKVIVSVPKATVELSPNEGYDIQKVDVFERKLNRFLVTEWPDLFPEKHNER